MTTASRPTVTETPATPALLSRRSVQVALAVIVLVLLRLVAPPLLGRLDYFHVQNVQLEGARFLTPTAVLGAIGTDTAASVFQDPRLLEARIESLPLVAAAHVRRRLPGTLVVDITERTPVALVSTPDGFRGVDSAGTRLPVDPALSAFDAPVVLPPLGPRDTAADRRLFNLLGAMRASARDMFDAIEEARRVGPTEWQFRTARQRVRTTPEVTLARLSDIFPVEQDLARRRIRAAELDLRFRNLVIARLP